MTIRQWHRHTILRLQKLALSQSTRLKSKTFLKPDSHIRLATVFSGIGAVEQAFHEQVKPCNCFAGDIDPYPKSYLGNYKLNEDFWHNDITQFDAKSLEIRIDILVGGSPCQAFSMVGKRAGLEDTRGTLFYEFSRVVDEVQPKIFIYENVKGLLNHDNGKTWKVVKSVFIHLVMTYISK